MRALRALAPEVAITYIADTEGFPYGARDTAWLTARAERLVAAVARHTEPQAIVLACNTLSTLALQFLRARFSYSFVGTVPAIKVAAEHTRSKRFTLLATPNTANGAYVSSLIAQYASSCVVDCYGAPNLAAYAESMLLGEAIAPDVIAREIMPCFHDDERGKTDTIILGCTHYPLIAESLRAASRWEVMWVDSSSAIAKRALSQVHATAGAMQAYITHEDARARYAPVFAREGFSDVAVLAV